MKNKLFCEEQSEDFRKILLSALLFVCSVLIGLFFNGVPQYVRIIIFIASYLICGFEVIKEAVENILHFELFDEAFLMCIASIGAMVLGDFAEGAAVMILFKVGELFEDVACNKTRASITSLMNLKPDETRVIRDGKEVLCLPEEVQTGEVIAVYPGDRVALDGEIVEGGGNFDMSALTGESLPKYSSVGENIMSGAICSDSVCKIKVSGKYSESTVAKILNLVEESQNHKAKSENFIRRFSKIYTPCVIISALVLGIAVPLIFNLSFDIWVKRALAFLVVSCPCALVISVPLTFFCGIGGASSKGILVKGANYLEELSRVKTCVFDKTGTLTKGVFTVSCIHPEKMSESKLFDIAALAESFSNHPIARSIADAHSGHIQRDRVTDINEIAGKGVVCKIDGKETLAGNESLMKSKNIGIKECRHTGTVVHIAQNGEYLGHIVISDTIKDDSADAIKKLKRIGVKNNIMLTGDGEEIAKETAEQIGIDCVKASLLPQDKVGEMKTLIADKGDNEAVMFVGDGINDAPVLALADVGVAMGGIGSDAAVVASDVVLIDDSPSKIATAVSIAKKTMRIAKSNIVFSVAVKLAVLALAALGYAPMWLAVVADVGVMVVAVANAVRASV